MGINDNGLNILQNRAYFQKNCLAATNLPMHVWRRLLSSRQFHVFGHYIRWLWDHPFKTLANFSRFLTPTPYRRQFFLLSIRKFGKFLTPPPPLKHADNRWSQIAFSM